MSHIPLCIVSDKPWDLFDEGSRKIVLNTGHTLYFDPSPVLDGVGSVFYALENPSIVGGGKFWFTLSGENPDEYLVTNYHTAGTIPADIDVLFKIVGVDPALTFINEVIERLQTVTGKEEFALIPCG